MPMIKLKNVRLSFPSLFRKAVFNGEETKFEATFLIPKNDPQVKVIQAEIDKLLKSELKGAKLGDDKVCLKDGDGFEYQGYAGNWSIKASNDKRPLVIDRDKSPLTENENKPYAGCFVNANIEIWAQNNAYGKRINAKLLGVQFYDHGEPFATGSVASVDDFDDIDSEEF